MTVDGQQHSTDTLFEWQPLRIIYKPLHYQVKSWFQSRCKFHFFMCKMWFVWLVFNGTSTQKGQFVPTVGMRKASNEMQYLTFVTLHDNKVTHFTVKRTLTQTFIHLFIIMLTPSPIPSQIPHTLFDIISLGVNAVERHSQDIWKTVHTKSCARSKMPQYNMVNNILLFALVSGQQCVHRQEKIDKIW